MTKTKKRNAKIFYRIVPQENMKWDYVKIMKDKKNIFAANLQDLFRGNGLKPESFWQFETDGIFLNTPQSCIYETVTEGLIEKIMNGEDASIIAFGQTGSGKTTTISALEFPYEQIGILPRIVTDLFTRKKEVKQNTKINIQVSYIEISRNTVTDLLKEVPEKNYDMYSIKNIKKITVGHEMDVLKLIYQGEARKEFVSNGHKSNVATSVITFTLTTKNMDYSNPIQITSKLHLIDMAGVDTVGNLSCLNKHFLEIGQANALKSGLELFILVLCQDIPEYTQNKRRMNPLLNYLGEAFSNENNLRFIGHINIERENLPITLSMLRFSQVITGLKRKDKQIIHEENAEVLIQCLKDQVEQLKREKQYESVLLNKDLCININQSRIEHLQKTVEEFISAKTSAINLLNVGDAQMVLKIFKGVCNRYEIEKDKAFQEGFEKGVSAVRPKKSESILSLKSKGTSRRSLGRSKESILSAKNSTEKEQSPKGSRRTFKRQESKTSQKQKKKIQHVPTVRRSINSKKDMSSIISSFDKRETKSEQTYEMIPLPDVVPEYQEALDDFISNSKSTYSSHLEHYRANEKNLRESYNDYVKEIESLNALREIVELRKKDIVEYKLLWKSSKDGKVENESESHTSSEEELILQENLNLTESELLRQQENVLKAQAELKMYLNVRQEIRKFMKEDFDNFCKQNYQVPIPNVDAIDSLADETVELPPKVDIENPEYEETSKTISSHNKVFDFEDLKKLMKKELRKQENDKQKQRFWTKY